METTINTIEEFTQFLGCKAANHPLFCITPLSEIASYTASDKALRLNLYVIVLKDKTTCTAQYGWRSYDFSHGGVNFFSPGQIHHFGSQDADRTRWGWIVAFHPDFIKGFPLGAQIGRMKFFSYDVREALHLSEKERLSMSHILQSIEEEYDNRIDAQTQEIVVGETALLLTYAKRYYIRQFRTRSAVENDFVAKVQCIIDEQIDDSHSPMPNVTIIAEKLNMTPNYMSDMLKELTGRTTQQLIHDKVIERAQHLLLSTEWSVAEIAYRLGFEYPQYFNRLFKAKVGVTPLQYRAG